jgi:hypothetical protein
MNAKALLQFLTELQKQGNDLRLINVLYREDFDSDVQEINFVEEDLYDEQSNSVLQSIVLLTDNSDI